MNGEEQLRNRLRTAGEALQRAADLVSDLHRKHSRDPWDMDIDGMRIPVKPIYPFRWQTDHLFRRKPITRSDANRSPVGAKRRGTKS